MITIAILLPSGPKRLGGRGYGVWGTPSGVQGQSPSRGLGAKPPEADAYTQIYSCKKSLFSLQFTEFDQPGLGSLSRV